MPAWINSSGTWILNSFKPAGWENWERIAENMVAKKTAFQEANINVNKTANTETALKRSHQTIVRFGRQRSANVPPIKEKMKMGANSATEIMETAKAFPPVILTTYKRTEKLRTQMPIWRKTADSRIPWTTRL